MTLKTVDLPTGKLVILDIYNLEDSKVFKSWDMQPGNYTFEENRVRNGTRSDRESLKMSCVGENIIWKNNVEEYSRIPTESLFGDMDNINIAIGDPRVRDKILLKLRSDLGGKAEVISAARGRSVITLSHLLADKFSVSEGFNDDGVRVGLHLKYNAKA